MSILTEVVGMSKIQATIILEITSGILLLETSAKRRSAVKLE